MKLSSLRDLFLCLLSDIYVVENEIVAGVPHLIKKAHCEELKEALKDHLTETKVQIKRLDQVFKILGESPAKIAWSKDIKLLFKDLETFVRENPTSDLLDAAIIAMTQRVEHFEIATYGTLYEYADVLESDEIKKIIKESLKEECKADGSLNKLAKGGAFKCGINVKATHNV